MALCAELHDQAAKTVSSTVALVASATVGRSALSSQHEALGGEAATGPRLAAECLATVRQSTCWNLFEIML